MRKTLLAVALSVTALSAHADYQCSVTPRDDVILSPQQVQVKGENGNLVIKPDGNLTFNGKAYTLSAAQREQAQDYQASLRSSLPWIDEGARSRVEKGRKALDKNHYRTGWRQQQHAWSPDQAGCAAERTDEPHH